MGQCNSCESRTEDTSEVPAMVPQIVEIKFHAPPKRTGTSPMVSPRAEHSHHHHNASAANASAVALEATGADGGFAIATGVTHESNAETAVRDALGQVRARFGEGRRLSFVFVGCTSDYDCNEVACVLRDALGPAVPFMGGTQSTGLFSERGWHSRDAGDCTLGLFAISDPAGYYAVGHAQLNTRGVALDADAQHCRARQAGATALLDVLLSTPKDVGRPNGIWMISEMGSEEGVLQGISDVLRASGVRPCAVGGGSSGNSDGSHAGRQIANGKSHMNSCVLAVMHSSAHISGSFGNGFKPTEHSGIITKAAGHVIMEIDNRPAADVYDEWADGILKDASPGQAQLHSVALTPLGRIKLHGENGEPQFVLSTTLEVTEGRGLHVLTEINQGERIFLMRATPESVVKNITATARQMVRQSKAEAHGFLVAFCSCYVLRFRAQFQEIAANVSRVLGKPWLATNTFGEQGTFAGIEGLWAHGNLMISGFVFYGSRRITDDTVLSHPAPPIGDVALVLVDMPGFKSLRAKNSTAADQSKMLFKQFLEVRLSAVRGYLSPLQFLEGTEADKCVALVATPTALDAVTLILTLQTLLINLAWPEEVLAMPECKEIRGPKGNVLYRGPRFRLAAHFGRPDFVFEPGVEGTPGFVRYHGKMLDDLALIHDCIAPGTSVITQELFEEAATSVTHYFQKATTLEKAVKNISFVRPPRTAKPVPAGKSAIIGILSKHLAERVDIVLDA